jgi:putative membrane protein
MLKILSDEERVRLDNRIADAEKRTNAQIVLAVIKRSDNFAEVPWKAFALGASIASLIVFVLDLLLYYRVTSAMVLVAVTTILAAGGAFALLSVFVPKIARLFLSSDRAVVEVRQYAESLFLNRELFATSNRTGILLLVSLFERQIVILPDKGLTSRLTGDAMRSIISRMTGHLTRNDVYRAMEDGLERLTQVLETSKAGKAPGKNELSDQIIEEKGV